MSSSSYFKLVVILITSLIIWTLRDFLLLIICSLVISNIVCNLCNQIQKGLKIPRSLSLFFVSTVISVIVFTIFILVLPPFVKEFNQILVDIPNGLSKINVSSDGIVSVQVPGQVDAQEVGQLQLADFQNKTGLQPIGENFYVETTASGPPVLENPFVAGFGKVVQGALESSNVNVVQELVDMIETQRAYEVNSKAITSVDEMLRFVSNNL